MNGWREVHVGVEADDLTIGGLGIWQQEWRRSAEDAIELPHPSHKHQLHRFNIYEAGPIKDPVRFAAAELSNGVWGFYVPE